MPCILARDRGLGTAVLRRNLSVAAALLLFLFAVTAVVLADDRPRFEAIDHLPALRADWVTMYEDRLAFGAGTTVYLARAGEALVVEAQIRLDEPILEGVLDWGHLYLNTGRSLATLDLSSPSARPVRMRLAPEPRAGLRVALRDNELIVAEDGVGLRFLELPPPPGMREPGHEHHALPAPEPFRMLPLRESFTALAASGGLLYLGLEGNRMAVVDARQPDDSGIRIVHLGRSATAMSANGSTVYVLGPEGLTLVDLPAEAPVRVRGAYPDVVGSAHYLAGRTLYVAAGELGLVSYRDQAAVAATHFVTVQNFTFVPASISIAVGDTVQWDNVQGFHNVLADSGAFGNGPPSSSPWTYMFTFTAALLGDNVYHCTVHGAPGGIGMSGTVTVNASPPGVPDGLTGPALLVGKVTAAGDRLSLTYDTSTCSATDHQIIRGFGSGLPASLGGSYNVTVGGSRCSIGTTSPFVWTGVPDPVTDPTRFLWFLVLAENGSVEGSWGNDSGGSERSAGVASGECGLVGKDVSNACGH